MLVNLNFVALAIAALFIIVFLLAVIALDRTSRLEGREYRKMEGVIIAVIAFLALIALAESLPEYQGYIIPTAFVALVFSLTVTFGKDSGNKGSNATAGGKGNGPANAGPRVKF